MTVFASIPVDVRRLLAAHGLGATAMGVPWPALLVAVWEESHNSVVLGVAGAARMLPYVVLSWIAGRLADRFARGRMVKLSLVLRVVLLSAAGLALLRGHVTTAVTCTCLAVACGTPAYPALAAEMPLLAGRANEAATGLLVTLEVAAFFVGPALGGLAVAFGAGSATCWLGAAMSLAALSYVVRVPWASEGRSAGTGLSSLGDRPGVVSVLVRRPVAIAAIAGVALNNAVLGSVGVALLPLADVAWSGDGDQFGVATAALGAGALAAPLLLRIWGISSPAGRRSAVVLAGFLCATVLSPGLVWALVPLALAGAASVHVEAVATGIIQEASPNSARSSILGLTDSIMVGAAGVAAAATPRLAHVLGARAVLMLCAVGALAMLLLFRREGGTQPEPVRFGVSRSGAPVVSTSRGVDR